ncbi:MAG TPA: XRE family transcriptional regulator [Candidatus Aminicenantes bacterium]|nr:XRE family transcriptional regulator [Candidatus Aminicenantes bacterium]
MTLQEWKRSKKLSNAEISLLLNVSEGWVSKWLSGKTTACSLDLAEKIRRRSRGKITAKDLSREKREMKNAEKKEAHNP